MNQSVDWDGEPMVEASYDVLFDFHNDTKYRAGVTLPVHYERHKVSPERFAEAICEQYNQGAFPPPPSMIEFVSRLEDVL